MNYKIKEEWQNKTIKVYSKHTGTRAMSTATIDMAKIEYYFSIGLKHIFEEVVTATTDEVVVIEYKAVEGPIPESTKKKRKPKKFTERLAEVKKEQESINTSVDTDGKA